MEIIEIDPKNKYVIVFNRELRLDEIERVHAAFKDFVETPSRHFLIIDYARLVKIDEVNIPAVDTGEG